MRATAYDSDDLLIAAFQEGKQDAFTQIYHRFNRGLYYSSRRFVTHENASDAVADAFVRLWHERLSFDALPKIERWLFVTVRNHCFAVLRREIRHQNAQDEILHQLELTEVSNLVSEELTTELIALLEKEIDRLPARQREVFILSFQEGLKPAAIAERLQLSVKTVKNQKMSAIKLLQAAVGDRAVILALLVLLHEEFATAIHV